MLYRRKVLLALLEALDRQVTRTDLQKYLFLVAGEQEHPSYHFVPYRYGCYSFNADADRRALARDGLVETHNLWVLASKKRYLTSLRPADREAVRTIVDRFKRVRGRELLRHVYLTHPYYAINSDILNAVLDVAEQDKVDAARPVERSPRLFTIGYEGLTLEQFLNRLIQNSVGVLCDVRRNAYSRKYGFAKRTLEGACTQSGIRYAHIPELGIDSNRRKHLRTRADYATLLRDYSMTTLPENNDALESINRLVDEHRRVALTCFEADPAHCHRGCVADALVAKGSLAHPVAHL
ncbi:MAG: DUF488 domain-containing protein [Gammaproteobacteria bacterium]|nr:DUF488 domain-containing protein [Gammaproteobacteria bacterium]